MSIVTTSMLIIIHRRRPPVHHDRDWPSTLTQQTSQLLTRGMKNDTKKTHGLRCYVFFFQASHRVLAFDFVPGLMQCFLVPTKHPCLPASSEPENLQCIAFACHRVLACTCLRRSSVSWLLTAKVCQLAQPRWDMDRLMRHGAAATAAAIALVGATF